MERNLDVDVIEAGALDLSIAEVSRRLQADPTVSSALILVRTSLPTIDWDLEVCRQLKIECAPAGVAIFGAAVPSLRRRIEADDAIDYAVLGEPDETVIELMKGRASCSDSGPAVSSRPEVGANRAAALRARPRQHAVSPLGTAAIRPLRHPQVLDLRTPPISSDADLTRLSVRVQLLPVSSRVKG